jgi:hypothetical protein
LPPTPDSVNLKGQTRKASHQPCLVIADAGPDAGDALLGLFIVEREAITPDALQFAREAGEVG